jgi:ATP-dependent exoDNAse (exonuclease V) beta subunit
VFADYGVVWWDPRALVLDEKPTFGIRRDDLIVKDVPRNVIANGRTRYDTWHLARTDARSRGAVPSLALTTAGDWAAVDAVSSDSFQAAAATVSVVRIAGSTERPGGTAFGVLVHALLALAPFDAERSALEDLAAREARLTGSDADEQAAAVDIVARTLRHDLLVRARAADARGVCRRETPITCMLADGTMVEGVVDLAFEENGNWTVVDYKTDRELATIGEDRYRRQIALYASAISQSTGQSAAGVLVRV